MTSISSLAAKGSKCDTVRLCGPACFLLGRNSLNCVNPNAVKMDMMFVSWLKSKYRDWLRGKVSVLSSSVTLI